MNPAIKKSRSGIARVTVRAIAWAVAMCVILAPQLAVACPTCKDGLHNDTAFGYAVSILFMMGMPFAIFTFWCVVIVRLRKKAAILAEARNETLADQTLQAL